MVKDVLTVRDVSKAIWRKFRAASEQEGMNTGQALNEAIAMWIKEKEARRKRLDPHHFLKVRGIMKAKKPVRWSEEVDLSIYGESS